MDSDTATTMLNAINMKIRMPQQMPTQDSVLQELQTLMAAMGNTSTPSISKTLPVTD
jgi:hypothetical protein